MQRAASYTEVVQHPKNITPSAFPAFIVIPLVSLADALAFLCYSGIRFGVPVVFGAMHLSSINGSNGFRAKSKGITPRCLWM
jgi:hypothetical protein